MKRYYKIFASFFRCSFRSRHSLQGVIICFSKISVQTPCR